MEEENKDTNAKSTIDAVTGLIKAVPVYQDIIQPAAKQIGQSLETVTKTVNIALAPIKALVWGYELIEEFISTRVSEKLKNVPAENIITPSPQVAGPAIESLRFSGHDQNLRELYANLIATAMDKATVHNAHPGFVEILKNLNSDEAILLQAFTIQNKYPLIDLNLEIKEENGYTIEYRNYSNFHRNSILACSECVPTYIDNLCRLGILEIPAFLKITSPNTYEPLESDQQLNELKSKIENDNQQKVVFNRKVLMLTAFGSQFVDNVVKGKN